MSASQAAEGLKALSAEAEDASYELGKFLSEEIAEEIAAETIERETENEAAEFAILDGAEEAAETEEVDEEPVAPKTKA